MNRVVQVNRVSRLGPLRLTLRGMRRCVHPPGFFFGKRTKPTTSGVRRSIELDRPDDSDLFDVEPLLDRVEHVHVDFSLVAQALEGLSLAIDDRKPQGAILPPITLRAIKTGVVPGVGFLFEPLLKAAPLGFCAVDCLLARSDLDRDIAFIA